MKHKTLRTLLCVILTVCFCLSAIVPASAAGLFGGDSGAATGWDQLIRGLKDRFIEKNPGTDETPAEPMAGAGEEFIRIFHLDCGRKYFTVQQIKDIIDQLAANHYTHIELAFGNDGLRFLLDDMSVKFTVDNINYEYTTENVTAGIKAGNATYSTKEGYYPATSELTQAEMNEIISYANGKNVSIIPLLNSPGHMDAILECMKTVGISSPAYHNSARTVDVSQKDAVAFTQALIKKYVDYFADKGCKYFNIGADEYANDVTNGFAGLIVEKKYDKFIEYVNNIAEYILNKSMAPIAFNDGIYYNSKTEYGEFNKGIVISYWTVGWPGYSPASASFLAGKGHKIINTNDGWYYVLKNANSTYTYSNSYTKTRSVPVTDVPGNNDPTPIGAMLAFWCDEPKYTYDESEFSKIKTLIENLSKANPTYFTAVTPPAPTISGAPTEAMVIRSSVTLSVSGSADATWTVDNENVLKLEAVTTDAVAAAVGTVIAQSVKVTALQRGTATVTAEVDGSPAASVTISVRDASDPVNPENINLSIGESVTRIQQGNVENSIGLYNTDVVEVSAKHNSAAGTITAIKASQSSLVSGKEYFISDGANYLSLSAEGSIYNETDPSKATRWTLSSVSSVRSSWRISKDQFYLRYENGLTVYQEARNATSWTISTQFIYVTSKSNYYHINFDGNNWGTRQWNTNNVTAPYVYEIQQSESVDQTTITFKGKAVGTTSVTIGGVQYNITVTEKAPDGALTSQTLTLEYWITNLKVYDGTTTSTNHTQSISSANAASEDGIEIKRFAPGQAYVFLDDGSTAPVYYWQAMRLDADNQQTEASGDDETADGTTLTHVRYHSGAWQYKTVDGTWHYFMTGDQLVAYYLQKTEVTKEIVTYVKDWGYVTSSTTPDTSSGNGQVALTVAVVYPDGSVSPAEANMYSQSTTIFNYWAGRDIGIVAPVNNGDYNIAKITVTNGTRDNNTSANVWYTSDTITWDKKTLDDGTKWYNETEVWNKSSGTTPMVNGKNSNITWSAKNTAKLVLIYLETIEKPDNLTVIYYDDNADAEITRVPVVVENGVTFKTHLKDGNNVIGGTMNWPADTAGEGYLPDDAYVTNTSGVNQTFSKQISTLQNISSVYKSGIYKYVSANIDEKDDKILILHFDLKSAEGAFSFVVDFGLPITILPGDIGITNTTTIQKASLTKATSVLSNKGIYGTATIAGNYSNLTYTLHRPLDKIATIPLFVTFEDGVQQEFQINIIAATNVYYEETFIENNGWTVDPGQTKNQALEKAGAKQNVYGYDPNVANQNANIGYSMGGVYHTTLSLTDLSDTSFMFSNPLTFTFEGTGLDLISACNTNTGMLYVEVIGKEKGGAYRALVDTYFRGDDSIIVNGETVYQVPVVRKLDLPYDMYTVTIKGYLYNGAGAVVKASTNAVAEVNSFSSYMVEEDALSTLVNALAIPGLTEEDIDVIYMDENSILNPNAAVAAADRSMAAYTLDVASNAAATAEVYVDGFRVYNPLGSSGTVVYEEKDANGEVVASHKSYISLTDNDAYKKDNEAGVVYYPVYDFIKNSAADLSELNDVIGVYIEYDGKTGVSAIADYKNQGPQNEVYLAPDCAIAFGINGFNSGDVLDVSARKVYGDSVLTDSNGNIDSINSTEMYYSIAYTTTDDGTNKPYALLQNVGNGVIAISGIKVSSNIKPYMDGELAKAIVKKLNPPAGDQSFTPVTFEVKTPKSNPKANRNFVVNVKASAYRGEANDVTRVTLSAVNKGTNEVAVAVHDLTPSNTRAVTNKVSKNWNFNELCKLAAGTYTFTITAYNDADETAVYTVDVTVVN